MSGSATRARPRPDAVTFDFWNTLVYEEAGHLRGRRLDAWAGILEEAGFALEREVLDAVFETAWNDYVDRWTANQQYRAAEAAEQIIERIGFDVPDEVRAELVRTFAEAGRDAELHLTDGVADAIGALR